MKSFFNTEFFKILDQAITGAQLTAVSAVILVSLILYWVLTKMLLTRYFERRTVKVKSERIVRVSFRYVFVFAALIGILMILHLDYTFYDGRGIVFRISTILQTLLIIQLARLADWGISKILLHNYNKTRKGESLSTASNLTAANKPEKRSHIIRYLVYIIAAVLVLQNLRLDFDLFRLGGTIVKISSLFNVVLVMLLANLFAWVITELIMHSYYRKNEVNVGSRYAINQLLKYIIYAIAVFVAVETLGVKMTVVWGGLAALLVGVGLGLQQTFNDLFSGIILLFERTVEVGDVVEISSLIGTVKRIGLRTSTIESRDNRTVFVPNSKLIMDNVVNWTHNDDKVRFTIIIGVAYGSDTEKVKDLLIKAAKENIYVMEKPVPSVRFIDFGDSALTFELMIWSRNFIVIEDIKSDLRFEVDRLFRENEITIPFPQRDVWMRK